MVAAVVLFVGDLRGARHAEAGITSSKCVDEARDQRGDRAYCVDRGGGDAKERRAWKSSNDWESHVELSRGGNEKEGRRCSV